MGLDYLTQFSHEVMDVGKDDKMMVLDWSLELEMEVWGTDDNVHIYSPDGAEKFVVWCEKHSVHYYSGHSENYSAHEGMRQAIEKGSTACLLESMS